MYKQREVNQVMARIVELLPELVRFQRLNEFGDSGISVFGVRRLGHLISNLEQRSTTEHFGEWYDRYRKIKGANYSYPGPTTLEDVRRLFDELRIIFADREQIESATCRKRQPRQVAPSNPSPSKSVVPIEKLIRRWSYLIPRRYREDSISDLVDDVRGMRAEEMTERQIRRYVAGQAILLFLIKSWENLKLHRWAWLLAVKHWVFSGPH